MLPQLSPELRQAIDAQPNVPLRIVDPRTNETYVLVPAGAYERFKALFEAEEFDVREAYPLMDAVAKKEGWDDPAMDIYDDLDPRIVDLFSFRARPTSRRRPGASRASP